MPVKVCIVGCGALGSVFAAHLARLSDVEVHAYDVSEEHTRAINDSGLKISGAANFTVRLHATRNSQQIPACDFGILATKSVHTRAAIEQTAHVFRDSGALCSVQNGLGNEEIVAEHVKYVIRGATPMAAHLIAPGHAGFEFYSDIWIGPFEPSGTPYKYVEQLTALLARAGLQVVPLQDARGWQWTKLVFNSAVNPVGALTQLHHGAATRVFQSFYQRPQCAIQRHSNAQLFAQIGDGSVHEIYLGLPLCADVLQHADVSLSGCTGAFSDHFAGIST